MKYWWIRSKSQTTTTKKLQICIWLLTTWETHARTHKHTHHYNEYFKVWTRHQTNTRHSCKNAGQATAPFDYHNVTLCCDLLDQQHTFRCEWDTKCVQIQTEPNFEYTQFCYHRMPFAHPSAPPPCPRPKEREKTTNEDGKEEREKK